MDIKSFATITNLHFRATELRVMNVWVTFHLALLFKKQNKTLLTSSTQSTETINYLKQM